MDRDVLDVIEREIDQEARMRFTAPPRGGPCCCNTAMTRRIEPGICGSGCCSTWTGRRTSGATPDGIRESQRDGDLAQFRGYLATKLREIMMVRRVRV